MTPAVVVDTDIVSFVFKGDSRAGLYGPHLTGRSLVISFMTVAELELWAAQHGWGEVRRVRLERYPEGFGVYWVHRALCREWGRVVAGARRKGQPIQSADAWIAATALVQNLPLVTHNAADFRAVDGLRIITESS